MKKYLYFGLVLVLILMVALSGCGGGNGRGGYGGGGNGGGGNTPYLPTITTIAGTGVAGYDGDGGKAIDAKLNSPWGVAVDSYGNIYIADTNNYRIRKVDSSGDISTFAGNGSFGFAGDGGPATSAQLNVPRGVAVDSEGNIYIADKDNDRIRKVDSTSGIISMLVGKDSSYPAKFVALENPSGVAVDSNGNIFIADSTNHYIRKVSSGVISTFVGKDSSEYNADLNLPLGVAVDSNRNLYIADTNNHCIRKVNLTSKSISIIAGIKSEPPGHSGDGSQAKEAKLNTPSGVAVDSHGNVYIADWGNNCIRKVNSEGIISTFVGNKGSAIYADLKGPRGVAVDSDGNIYIADTDNHRVLKVINPDNNQI